MPAYNSIGHIIYVCSNSGISLSLKRGAFL
jgi:hypothetical protein